MRPICFTCSHRLPFQPDEIAQRILDVANWSGFRGYGPLPGVRKADFDHRTPQVVGSRIRVENTDGSRHVEDIVEWDPQQRLQLVLSEFSPPLSRLATHFDETWEFTPAGNETRVDRSMCLHPRSAWTKPPLWLISLLLRRAIARHLRELQ